MDCDSCANVTGGGGNLKKLSPKKRKPLPLVGPITYYLPIRNGRPCKDGLTGELRLIAEAEIRIVRGEFEGMDRFYAAIRKDGPNFLSAAGIALFSAVGSNDPFLFDVVIKDIAAYPSRYGTPEAKLAVEIVMVWLRHFLKAPMECPSWLENLDLSYLPGVWRRQAAYLAVNCLNRKGENKAAAVLADSLLNLDAEKAVKSSAADIYLKMAKATICRDEGRLDEAERWCRAVVESAKPLGIVLPFLGVVMGPKSAMERALASEAPELLAKVKKLTNGYFRNLVRFHNRYTGEKVCEDLTPREFYLAQCLKGGLRYKEIAERLGVSVANVHNMVVVVYEKLHIRSNRSIGGKVW